MFDSLFQQICNSFLKIISFKQENQVRKQPIICSVSADINNDQ